MSDRYEKLDVAESFFFDILSLAEPPGFFVMEVVDMQATQTIMAQMRQQGIKGTYTHIIVRAVALVLSRHPDLNRLILGNHIVYPDTIDIGMSVRSGLSMAVNPTMVLQDAGKKDLVQIAEEIILRAPQVRAREPQRMERMRKMARRIPFSLLRRAFMHLKKSQMSRLRQKTGTFHITSVPDIYQGVTFKYATPAVLVITRVEDRVIAKDGQAVVRPMVTLGFAGDHRLWTGNSAAVFMNELKKILEEGELATEILSPVEEVSSIPLPA